MHFYARRVLALAGLLFAVSTVHCQAIDLPPSQEQKVQGWKEQERQQWYHTSAGTQLIPYDWFVALMDTDNELEKTFEHTGILRNEVRKDRLSVGLSEPKTSTPSSSSTGMNCAFCHTTEFTYQNKKIRIEGGPSLQDNQQFLNVLMMRLNGLISPDLPTVLKQIKEQNPPERFKAFAARVLQQRKEGMSTETLTKLAMDVATHTRTLLSRGGRDISPARWGPGRFDALGRGGNTVFSPLNPDNLRPANAPVSIPPLWGVWEYDWVQWAGSIQHPLARNVAQVIGVNAGLFAWAQKPPLGPLDEDYKFRSSIDFESLKKLEHLARELQPPQWPKEFPRIDGNLAARGKDLYHGNKAKGIPNRCAHCHVATPVKDPGPHGPRLQVTMIPQSEIGTDSLYLENFSRRTVDTGLLGQGRLSAREASQYVTTELLARNHIENDPEYAQRRNEWRDWPQYIARPHLAVWATAPFLHNGSVPNLYELLSPAGERHRCFILSPNMEFDPKQVGFAIKECDSTVGPPGPLTGFKFDTSLPGNGNGGHEFANSQNCDGPANNGILGCEIPQQDRYAIIEYLKTCDLDHLVIRDAPDCHDLGESTR
jgi:cytochrome c553